MQQQSENGLRLVDYCEGDYVGYVNSKSHTRHGIFSF